MEKPIQIHHGKEHLPNCIWWKAPFAWQENINHYLTSMMPADVREIEKNWFSSFQNEMHKVFCELFNSRQTVMPFFHGARTEPYIDILEGENAYIINADVPGASPDNVHVQFTDDSLIIRGKRYNPKSTSAHYIHKECCHDYFERVIALPECADFKNASASIDQCVLTIKIPKHKSVRHHKKTAANDYNPRKEASDQFERCIR